MTRDDSQQGVPGVPPGSGGADVVEQDGGPRLPRLRWRSPRSIALLAGVALLAGLAAGYAAGDRQAASRPPQRPAASPASPTPPLVIAAYPSLIQSTGVCATQTGRDLQLGVQVINQSAAEITLSQVEAVLPLGGLRAISQQWGPCGFLPAGGDLEGNSLAPGASAWFTMTFKVLMKCPGPLPVQFKVRYSFQDQSVAASLPGFPDLSQVPYTGCPAS